MNKFRKKQSVMRVVIAIIVVLFILPGDLMAKKVAQLSIEKIDQKTIEGKLIHVDVKEKSLVLNSDKGGVKIYINEINIIKIKKKSLGSDAKGFLVGFVVGGGLALFSYDENDVCFPRDSFVLVVGCVLGFVGLIIGTIAGDSKEYYKKIRVKGKSQKEVRKILKRLKKKALYR